MSKELFAIQYLRGLAAAIVVLHHLFSTRGLEYMFLPWLGGVGVDIFFVISGFIMWHTTAEVQIGTIEFWRRRIIRIVPLYWTFLFAIVIAALLVPRLFYTTAINLENTIKSFLFIPHRHAVQNIIAPILIPGWSLNYEMFFYLLFGAALIAPSRPRRAILLATLLLGLVLLGLVFQPTGAIAATYTSSGLLKFLDGIVLAIIYRLKPGKFNDTTLGLILVSVGIFSLFIPDSSTFGLLESFVGLSPALIVAGALALEPALASAPNLLFLTVGNASYSIYLSHLFFLRLPELGWRHFALFGSSKYLDATYVTVALIFSIAGGVLVYRLVERPMLSLLQRRRAPADPGGLGEESGQKISQVR